MVRTRLTAAEPYTSGRLQVIVDLDPEDTVAALEAALTGLPPSTQTRLWMDDRELAREASVRAAGIRDGVELFVGGPSRRPRPAQTPMEVRLVSGPQAGTVHPIPEGDAVVGGPGTDVVLSGLTGQQLLLASGPGGLVASSLDRSQPVRRAGVELMTAIALSPGDQLQVGPHLLAVGPAPQQTTRQNPASGTVRRARREPLDVGGRTLDPPVPPAEPPLPRLALVPALVPLGLGLLLGLTLATGFLLLALASPLVAYGIRWNEQRRAADAHQQALADHDQALSEFAAETTRLLRAELAARRDAAPDPVALLRAAADAQVWQRARTDDDALVLRVGTSSTNATSWRVGEQPPQLLHDVPVTVPLRRAGALGIAASDSSGRPLARWLVAQAAALHSPDELLIWLLADPTGAAHDDWDWLRWLPHNWGAPEQCANLIGATDHTLAVRIAELTALVAERRALAVPAPDVLVVLDGEVGHLPGVPELLRDGPGLGVFALCVGSVAPPKQCRTVVSIAPDGRLTITGSGALPVRDVRADLVDVDWAEQVARALAPLLPADPGPGPLPFSVPLPAPQGTAAVEQRWQSRTAAFVGVTADGPLELDLTHGPHVLLAGGDGEQARTLLQTVVVSLALSRSPDELSLVLVELDELADLPHVSSVFTDLEGSQAARVLAWLAAEQSRREVLLDSVGAVDLDAFVAAGHGPLPRLVIAMDEIATTAEVLPDFLTRLVTLLHVSGRVGIHLVLSTRSPSAVPLQVLAATTIRLALRLDDAAASERVLGSAAAAGLLAGVAGRGYARFGNGPVLPFQAASLTAPPAPRSPLHAEELAWPRLGLPLTQPAPGEPALPGLVVAMRGAWPALPSRPWWEPLPERILLDDLRAQQDGSPLALAFGLEDLPAEQTQRTAAWDLAEGSNLLAVGGPRSGRSTLLLTIAAALARSSSPSTVHLYALDCGNGALRTLAELPHCGAVVSAEDRDRADRLLTRLAAEVARRRRQLAERGFSDLAAQRKGTADPLPYLVLLVDGWEGFTASLARVGDGRLVETLADLLRDGGPAGLRIAITGDSSVLTSEVADLLPQRLVLRLEPSADYELAGLEPASVPAHVPPGRAFRTQRGQIVPAVSTVQIALLPVDLTDLAAELPPARGRKPFRVDVLPSQIAWVDAHQLTPSGPGAALAVGGDELRLQTINLLTCGPGFTVAGPPGSGRSTALVVLARSLLEVGTQLCLITPAPSPLAELRGAPGVVGSDDLVAALDRAQGPVVVFVDDADQLRGELNEQLQEVLRTARARDRAIVLAGDTERLAASVSGFAFDARRSRSGLLLAPAAPEQGDLLGVRLDRSAVFAGPPGRGLLVRSGDVQLVQVPHPE